MNKANKLLLLIGLAILGIWIVLGHQRCTTETEKIHTIYLPIIHVGSKPAMKGVGLSRSYNAIGRLGVEWYYTWGWKTPVEAPTPDRRFVPMIWGKSLSNLSNAVAIAKTGSGWLLGFNEPDRTDQANMTWAEGAVLWHQIEEQAGDIRLASPAPSQLDFGWLWGMVGEYQRRYGHKPRFDAIAVHYYAWSGNPNDVKNFLLRVRREAVAHGYGDAQIWLTEFAGLCTKSDPAGGHRLIMRELIPWMKQQSWIGRYAWFASELPDPPATADLEYCSLTIPGTGQLSELGKLYKGM